MNKSRSILISLLAVLSLAACGDAAGAGNSEPAQTESIAEATLQPETVQPETEQSREDRPEADQSDAASSKKAGLIRVHTATHQYLHGEDGYFNLLESGVDFDMVPQLSGTCWICASSCAMSTAYQMQYGRKLVFDQFDLLNEIYGEDKVEGVFTAAGTDKKKIGGFGGFVVNELSRGFGDGLAIDGTVDMKDRSMEEVKEGIRRYGALYIGAPDAKKGYHDGYYTMNFPDARPAEYDHSIAVLGWDDHFPRENFQIEASRDGAWITYNSRHPRDYFYVSYDTPFDEISDTPLFLSVTDRYPRVLSHDCGYWGAEPVCAGETTVTANVFREKGMLAAVGTYTLTDDQDLTIRILTPDLAECLYSQECRAERAGYHVFELKEPMEVDEYAIAVTYPAGAPVEGMSMEPDRSLRVDIVSEKGQSYIRIGDAWLDMSEASTGDRLGCVTNNACIRALYEK